MSSDLHSMSMSISMGILKTRRPPARLVSIEVDDEKKSV